MTQTELFQPPLYWKVAAYLMDRPGVWVDGMELAKRGGIYGWRTRVSECRRFLGMTIENRVRREGRRAISEYRLVKSIGAGQ